MDIFAHRAKAARSGMARLGISLAVLAAFAVPAVAQPSAQPSGGIDSDLAPANGGYAPPPPPPPPYQSPPPYQQAAPDSPPVAPPPPDAPYPAPQPQYPNAQPMATGPATAPCGRQNASGAYDSNDLIGAAEGVFGSGARGLAAVIRDILSKQGAPDGYIAGREAGGAFVVGLRYGSGLLCQRAQEALPVYWTGPSVGFDAGAEGGKTFVLVYNLNNPDDLFRRFGAGEGQAYLVGGFNVSYLRRGNVVLIPVRMGVGLRLGINGGYMKITRRLNWVPF